MSTAENNIIDALQMAVQHHSAGRLGEAQRLYQSVLSEQPANADALHLSGIIAQQTGHLAAAISLMNEAIAACPTVAAYHCNLAKALRDIGDHQAAVESFQRAISLQADMVDALFGLAGCLRILGRHAAAAEHLRRITILRANDPEAHAYLAAALKGAGDFAGAIAAYRTAVTLQPLYGVAHNNLGNLLRDAGRLDEAAAAYADAIAAKPDDAEAYSNLGNLLFQRGDLAGAEEKCQQAVDLKPEFSEAHNNLGNVLRAQNRLDEAVLCYRLALALNPKFADAHNNLGLTLHDGGLLNEAVESFEAALSLNPQFPAGLSNLAHVKCSQGKYEEAEALYRQALAISPDEAMFIGGLAIALHEQGRIDEAITEYRRAIAANPNAAVAYANLGAAYQARREIAEAIRHMRHAVSLAPNDAEKHGNLGIALLLDGQFEEGWREYEWRWQYKQNWKMHIFEQPRWDGSPLNGRTVLLFAEQGFGDELQFIRYAPMVAAMGGRVIVECHPQLKTLLATVSGISAVYGKGEKLPAFDCVLPQMSLPMIFGTTLATIPAETPYLKPDAALIAEWAERTASAPGKRRIGLCWQGDPKHKNDRNRSIPLTRFASLLKRPDLAFISLQKGPGSEQIAEAGLNGALIDETQAMRFDDFADAAALIMSLDLVITIDSAIAHLAGALGKPVWLLLPYASEWRWLHNRTDSPWYPQTTLFRQTQSKDWDGVLKQIAAALDQETE